MPTPSLIGHAAVLAGAVGINFDDLRRRAGTVVDAYRRRGPAGAAMAVAGRLPRRLIRIEWYSLFETLTPGDPGVPAWPGARRADADDVADLADLRGAPEAGIRERLDRGDRAYLVHDDGLLVGQIWYRAGSWREDDIEFSLADDERWGFDSFVRPTHRGRHIGPRLAVHALLDLQAGGVRRVVSVIDHLNAASLHAAKRYGAQPLSSIITIAVPGLELVRERLQGAAHGAWTGHPRDRPLVRRPPATPARR